MNCQVEEKFDLDSVEDVIVDALGGGDSSEAILRIPQWLRTFIILNRDINRVLKGTDTPSAASFIIRHGVDAINIFKALTGAASVTNILPANINIGKLPVSVNTENRPQISRPTNILKPSLHVPVYEPYPGRPPGEGVPPPGDIPGATVNLPLGSVGILPPGINPEDYIDETTKHQVLQTSTYLPEYFEPPTNPVKPPIYQPLPDYLNYNKDTGNRNENSEMQTLDKDKWQIHVTFRKKPGSNGTSVDFHLAHPDAFHKEYLESINFTIARIPTEREGNIGSTEAVGTQILKKLVPRNRIQEEGLQPIPYNPQMSLTTSRPVFVRNDYDSDSEKTRKRIFTTTQKPQIHQPKWSETRKGIIYNNRWYPNGFRPKASTSRTFILTSTSTQRTTTQITTPVTRRRKRRTKATTTTTPVPEFEYYYEEDETKKP